MSADAARVTEGSPRGGALRSLSRFSWRRPGAKTLAQISLPVAAFLFVYVAALIALLIQGFVIAFDVLLRHVHPISKQPQRR